MKDSIFYRQANLVLDILPLIAKFESFALKGGTAINYFLRDLPRLSVDIDLTFLPIEDRATTLGSIHSLLEELSKEIVETIPSINITPKINKSGKNIERLVLEQSGVTKKTQDSDDRIHAHQSSGRWPSSFSFHRYSKPFISNGSIGIGCYSTEH